MSREDDRITAVAEAFDSDLTSADGILLLSCTCAECLRAWAKTAVHALDKYDRENPAPKISHQ